MKKNSKLLLLLLLNFIIISCTSKKFELTNTLAESKDAVFYFESDTVIKVLKNNYIGGESVPIYKTDSSVYLNYNKKDEVIFKYMKQGDSLFLKREEVALSFVIKESNKENIFAFDRLFNENKRLGIPSTKFNLNRLKDLDREEAKKIISKIWRGAVAKYKYPKSVEYDYFFINGNKPKNKFERKWNDESLFDDYSFSLRVKAENFLKQKNESSQRGHVVIENGKLEEIYFDSEEGYKEKFEWRYYQQPENFTDEDMNSVDSILKNQYNIDMKNDVHSLRTITAGYKKQGYYNLWVDVKRKPSHFMYKYKKTDTKYFKLYKDENKIKIEKEF